jgi:hypothetical protein
VERQFQGTVFDVANAKRFVRVTATWWGVEAGHVEQIVEELARRVVCSEQPRFRLSLALEGIEMRFHVEQIAADAPAFEGSARVDRRRQRVTRHR